TPDPGAIEFSPAQNDIGIVAILSPRTGCGLGSADTVVVSLTNGGLADQVNFQLSYVFNNGTPVTATYSDTLFAGTTVSYSFATPINVGTPGQYNLYAYTSLANDALPINDTSFSNFTHIPLLSSTNLPY